MNNYTTEIQTKSSTPLKEDNILICIRIIEDIKNKIL